MKCCDNPVGLTENQGDVAHFVDGMAYLDEYLFRDVGETGPALLIFVSAEFLYQPDLHLVDGSLEHALLSMSSSVDFFHGYPLIGPRGSREGLIAAR